MQTQLIEAAVLLSVGMAVVFAFLTMLILGVHLITVFVRYFPGEQELTGNAPNKKHSNAGKHSQKSNTSETSIEPDVVAAISAAVTQYRKK